MLNQRGGHVLFGVTPEGDVVGQQVSERTIEEVSVEIQRIDPPAFPEIERVHVSDNREVITVRVNQGSARPYQYRGAAYRRVGNTTVAMSANEYNRMLFERMHSELCRGKKSPLGAEFIGPSQVQSWTRSDGICWGGRVVEVSQKWASDDGRTV